MVNAAQNGQWAAVRVLCTLLVDSSPTLRKAGQYNDVITAAAAQGNVDFLKWAWESKRVPLQEPAIAQAAANGNFHVLEWALQDQLPAHGHLLWKMFAVAIAHQNSSILSLMASLGLQVVGPGLERPASKGPQSVRAQSDIPLQQLAMSLTSARRGDPRWQVAFKDALGASPWQSPPSDNACMHSCSSRPTLHVDAKASQQYVDLVCWLRRMAQDNGLGTIEKLVEESKSIVPIQLAARGIQPRMPWGPKSHGLAGAHADSETLQWMTQEFQLHSRNIVHDSCPQARMLLLVERHGWTLPRHLQSGFETTAAKLRRLALWCVVQHQRKHLQGQPCLGSLEDEHLAVIARQAGFDPTQKPLNSPS